MNAEFYMPPAYGVGGTPPATPDRYVVRFGTLFCHVVPSFLHGNNTLFVRGPEDLLRIAADAVHIARATAGPDSPADVEARTWALAADCAAVPVAELLADTESVKAAYWRLAESAIARGWFRAVDPS